MPSSDDYETELLHPIMGRGFEILALASLVATDEAKNQVHTFAAYVDKYATDSLKPKLAELAEQGQDPEQLLLVFVFILRTFADSFDPAGVNTRDSGLLPPPRPSD